MADNNEIYVTKAKDAKPFIGKTLYWDDVGSRYCFLRSGKLVAVHGRYLEFENGDYELPSRFKGLRTFADGGAWLANKPKGA